MAGETDTPQGGERPLPLGARALAAARAVQATREAGTASGHPGVAPAAPAPIDPLSRPFRLPSRGIFYPEAPGWDGTVHISPTRGEQEEILAGAADKPEARLAALRHVAMQCIVPSDARVKFPRFTLEDWTAATLHFLAMSAGHDIIGLRPTHNAPGCNKASDQSRPLTELPCVTLRLGAQGETGDWPPAPSDAEQEETLIRELDEEDALGGITERIVALADAQEPFTATLPNGQRVTWKLIRMEDVAKGEEFAARAGDSQAKPGSPLHTYMLARHIVELDGKKTATLEAVQWVKTQPSPVLDVLREAINSRHFGYDVVPRFRCPHCAGSWRVRLPLDGGLFRRRIARTRGR